MQAGRRPHRRAWAALVRITCLFALAWWRPDFDNRQLHTGYWAEAKNRHLCLRAKPGST